MLTICSGYARIYLESAICVALWVVIHAGATLKNEVRSFFCMLNIGVETCGMSAVALADASVTVWRSLSSSVWLPGETSHLLMLVLPYGGLRLRSVCFLPMSRTC